jgi:hypothetical protein
VVISLGRESQLSGHFRRVYSITAPG